MEHRRVRSRDRSISHAQAQRDDAAPETVVRIVGIGGERHPFLFELGVELAELRRLLRQIAVDVAERGIDLVHDVDAVLDQAERHAGLQQNEAGANLLDEGSCLFGQDQLIRHKDVAELHAIGAGAVHRQERLAGLQRDCGIGTVGEKHDRAAGLVLALEDGTEEMIGTEIGHPGQRAPDDVAAVDLAALQLEFFDAEERLHRVGEPGAAEHASGGKAVAEARGELDVARVRGVPDQRVLAPRHEGGGAADLPDRSHRLDGAAQVGRPVLRDMAAPGADLAKPAQHFGGIDRTGVDGRGQRRQLLTRDPRHLVGNGRCGLIDRFDPMYSALI
eukprot:Opistho-1_new@19733